MFDGITTEELRKEIKRRKDEKPVAHKDANFKSVTDMCEKYVDDINRGVLGPLSKEDFKQYLYEEVMEIVFGREIWRWLRFHESA